MTRADKFEEIFGYRPATDQVLCNEHDWCGESDACNYCMCNPNNIGREEDWWNAEYKENDDKAFHCGIEESGGHAYNCNDCPNKCEEWYKWDKEFREKGDKDESNSNDN